MAQGTRVHVADLGSLVIIGFHRLQKGRFMRFTSNLSGSYGERRRGVSDAFVIGGEGITYKWSWSGEEQAWQHGEWQQRPWDAYYARVGKK
jgi:hypothetical protein